jgi:hypothetical protein
VRASAPQTLELQAEHYRRVGERLSESIGKNEIGQLSAELNAISAELSKALSAVAASVDRQDAAAYRIARDQVDELYAAERKATESGVKACDGIAPVKVIDRRLPAEHIQTRVRANHGRLRLCYEEGLKRNRELQGRVITRFTIKENGLVHNVMVNDRLIPVVPAELAALEFLRSVNGKLPPLQGGGTDMPDDDVIACVGSQYYKLVFDPPQGGEVTVTYPTRFSPADLI